MTGWKFKGTEKATGKLVRWQTTATFKTKQEMLDHCTKYFPGIAVIDCEMAEYPDQSGWKDVKAS